MTDSGHHIAPPFENPRSLPKPASAAWALASRHSDGEIIAALDEAINRADEVRDVTDWPEGHAPARLIARYLDPALLDIEWGVEAIARRMRNLVYDDLVAIESGFPALYAITPEGDDLLARMENGDA